MHTVYECMMYIFFSMSGGECLNVRHVSSLHFRLACSPSMFALHVLLACSPLNVRVHTLFCLLTQVLMAMFSHLYYWNCISKSSLTVGDVLSTALKLSNEQQVELFSHLGNMLVGEGLLPGAWVPRAD